MKTNHLKTVEVCSNFSDVATYCEDICRSVRNLMEWSKHIVHSKIPLKSMSSLLAALQRFFDSLTDVINFFEDKYASEQASRESKGKGKGKRRQTTTKAKG